MLVLQALNNLSDEQVEYQVRRPAFMSRAFWGCAIEDSIPDADDALAVPREAGQRPRLIATAMLTASTSMLAAQGLHGTWRADRRRQYRAGADAAEQS